MNLASNNPRFRPDSVNLPPPPIDASEFDHEWAVAAKFALAGAGPYSVVSDRLHPATTELHGQIHIGPLVVSNLPGFVGSTLVRNYTLYYRENGVFLKLTRESLGGGNSDLWWKRLG